MSTDLLRPPSTLTPAEALHRSQQAPAILADSLLGSLPYPFFLLTTSDAPERWTIYENLFYSCLRTGDNASALKCLSLLKTRFGDSNERVMGMMGTYHEAVAESEAKLLDFAAQYKEVIDDNGTNITVRKRRIALLRNLGRTTEAVADLAHLLDVSPIDAEAWAELADCYLSLGLYDKAVYCLEECLLVMPNAWNMHAKLAEVWCIVASSATGSERIQNLTCSMKYFCRSIELCDDYLRGFYGLKLTTTKLQEAMESPADVKSAQKAPADDDSFGAPSLEKVQKLNLLATKKLGEIVRRSSSKDPAWNGYEEAEIIAARELIDRDNPKAPR